MATFLPAPQHSYEVHKEGPSPAVQAEARAAAMAQAPRRPVPAYGQRQRFVPRTMADFGDGGAYPEVHVAQFPLNMGRPNAGNTPGGAGGGGGGGGIGVGQSSTSIVSVDVDETGKVKHDAIVKQGDNKNKIVYSRLNNTREKEADQELIAAPTQDEAAATAARTAQALAMILGKQADKSAPNPAAVGPVKAPEYIKYTPNPSAPGYNPAASQRIIRMVEAQVDPMEPAKHKHKKIPRGPPDAPVPVLHSPPRKVSVADQQAWKLPPSISNWKNAKGYTIPLDKRLASDGRGLQDVTVNTNFATLSEALYITERKARNETRLRGEMMKQLSLKEKETKEGELREMAARARMERAGIATGPEGGGKEEDSDDEGVPSQSDRPAAAAAAAGGGGGGGDSEGEEDGRRGEGDEEERVAAQQRDKLRAQRKRDREREIRLENMKGKGRTGMAERERDVSEKVALGQLKGKSQAGAGGEGLYDQRLFNQSSGMDAGFGGEDGYNVYSKDLFDKGAAQSIYRPKNDKGEVDGDALHKELEQGATKRFKADKGFKGTEGGHDGGPRKEPVQFERNKEEEDPFGLDSFLAKSNKKK